MKVINTKMIIAGGLGNQMFMFASSYALTKKWNTNLILLDIWYYGKQRGKKFKNFTRKYELDKFPEINRGFKKFSLIRQFLIYQFFRFLNKLKINSRLYFTESCPLYNEKLLVEPQNIMLGLFQSENYFKEFRNDIIKYFELDYKTENEILRFIQSYKTTLNQELVMVHIRREDSLVTGNDWTGILTIEYYKKVMSLFDHENTFYLIFSDSPDWCEQQLIFKNTFFIREPDAVKTLRMMQYCDHFILSGSTLSWWGAWLSQNLNKIIYAPYPFYKERNIDYEKDLIPNEFVRIPASFY
jgi:hypothetical protein